MWRRTDTPHSSSTFSQVRPALRRNRIDENNRLGHVGVSVSPSGEVDMKTAVTPAIHDKCFGAALQCLTGLADPHYTRFAAQGGDDACGDWV